jgi:hypothetical protein
VAEGHFYDTAGRLEDPGVTYDALGNVTKAPAIDTGGSPITSSFYVDNQVSVQEQSEKTVSYVYDPAGRAMVSTLKGKSGTTTTISHYAGPGEALTWTCEEAGECKEERESKWTRDIPGIGGTLDAIQSNGEAPVLQLRDLRGNIVGTASLSETATGLLTTHNNTEFGVPIGTAPKYSWLGAAGAASELGTGVITTAGASYVPQLAQTLQSEQVIPPGAEPNGIQVSGLYSLELSSEAIESGNYLASNTLTEERELEAQAEIAADGEGNDPTYYYTRGQARSIGKKLVGLVTYAEFLDAGYSLTDGVMKFLEGALLEKLDGVSKAFDWFRVTGKELIKCSEEALVCKLSFNEFKLKTPKVELYNPFTFKNETIWEFNIQLVNPFVPAVVQWCLGETTTHPKGCYS